MSDNTDNLEQTFKPMDVNTLENFDQEVSVKRPDTEPDFDRFKLLFDPAELDRGKDGAFEALDTVPNEVKQKLFEPLIEGTGFKSKVVPAPDGEPDTPLPDLPDASLEKSAPEKSDRDLGFEQGFEQGMAQGLEQGRTKGDARGFEEGFARGQAEGMEKGQAHGIAKGIEEGLEQGRAQGLEAAQAEVNAQVQQILSPLQESLETADRLLEMLLARYEGQIIELVYKIAQKVVAAHVDADDQTVSNTIMDALTHLVAPEQITLNVSPQDYEYVEMDKEAFFESVRSLKHIAVNSDPMISKGGCRIESAGAVISTDPESKLAAVYDAVVETLRK